MSKKKLFKLLWGISLTSVIPALIACSANEENNVKDEDSVNAQSDKDDLKEKEKLTDKKNNGQSSDKDKPKDKENNKEDDKKPEIQQDDNEKTQLKANIASKEQEIIAYLDELVDTKYNDLKKPLQSSLDNYQNSNKNNLDKHTKSKLSDIFNTLKNILDESMRKKEEIDKENEDYSVVDNTLIIKRKYITKGLLLQIWYDSNVDKDKIEVIEAPELEEILGDNIGRDGNEIKFSFSMFKNLTRLSLPKVKTMNYLDWFLSGDKLTENNINQDEIKELDLHIPNYELGDLESDDSFKKPTEEYQYDDVKPLTMFKNFKLKNNLIVNNVLLRATDNIEEFNNSEIEYIAPFAFANLKNIRSINVPNVKKIGYDAFTNASNLSSITAPKLEKIGAQDYESTSLNKNLIFGKALVRWEADSENFSNEDIEYIGPNVFKNASILKNVNIPNVKRIDSEAFSGTSLSSINVPKLEKVGYGVFNGTNLPGDLILGKALIRWSSEVENFDNQNIEFIAPAPFRYRGSLTSVNIPNVKEIGEDAFKDASSLSMINAPKLEKVGANAFYGTDLNENLIVGNRLIKGGKNVTELSNDNIEYIDSYAFRGNKSITTINLPNLKEIGEAAFWEAESLTTLNAPKLEKVAGGITFSGTKLSNDITIGKKLIKASINTTDFYNEEIEYIENEAFWLVKSLTSVNLPNVKEISEDSFRNNETITSVNLPKATWIGGDAFGVNESLTSANLPNVLGIGIGAFRDAKSLTSINAPKLKYVADTAFWGTDLNKDLIIGNRLIRAKSDTKEFSNEKIEEVDPFAFSGIKSLTSVNLPNVKKIGDSAFSGATSLSSIIVPKLESIGKNVFENTNLSENFIIGNKLIRAKSNITEFSSEEITEFDAGAFSGINSITSINLPNVRNLDSDFQFDWLLNLDNLKSLTSLTLGVESMHFFGNASYLHNLTTLNLPNITDFSFGVLHNLNNLHSLTLGVKNIPSGSFNDITSLRSINLPNATEVGSEAFSGATSLSSVIAPKLERAGENAFENTALPKGYKIGKVTV